MSDTCGKCGLERTATGHDLSKDPYECLNDPKAVEAGLKLLKFPDPKPLSGQPGPAGETTTPIEFMKINGKIYVSLNDLALWVARSKVTAVEKDELFHSLNRMNDHALANLPEAFQVQK